MPVQSVALFLISILASALLLGFSFALKINNNVRFLNYYFYFILSVICYGFVNWTGPTLFSYFIDLNAEKSNSVYIIFIAAVIPLALAKLYLFMLFLLKILDIQIKTQFSRIFYMVSTIVIIMAMYFLWGDIGGKDFNNSRNFIILFGVIILVANFISIFYFLSRIEILEHKQLQSHARTFGWVYLIGYFVYASPYYITFFLEFSWLQIVSPYLYYTLHLIPLFFLKQYCQLDQHLNPIGASTTINLESVAKKFNISRREIAILELIIIGKSNHQIADQLSISPNTVRNHIYNIYGKTKVKNRIQLKLLCEC